MLPKLLAAALVACVSCSLYNPHVPTTGSFFEGWYTRIISADGNSSFAVFFGLTQAASTPSSQLPRAVITIAYQDHNRPGATMQAFSAFPDPATINITSNGSPVTADPDYKSPSNFRWDAGELGYFETRGEATSMNFSVGGASFLAYTSSITPWASDGSGCGPAGFLDSLPIPLHWFVYSLSSSVVSYAFVNGRSEVSGFGGSAHMEKNWGDAFPGKWIWAEAQDSRDSAAEASGVAFAFSGGDLPLKWSTLPIDVAHLAGYRNPSKQLEWNFTPAESRLNMTLDACNGSFSFDLHHTTLPRRLSVTMTAPTSSLRTCLWGPAANHFAPMCTESFLTTIEITAYKRSHVAHDEILDHVVLNNAALEFGGDFRCKNPDPCQQPFS